MFNLFYNYSTIINTVYRETFDLHTTVNVFRSVIKLCMFSRQVGVQQWASIDTNSNKGSAVLTVLMPDTTYQVKVQTQCLSKQHRTNEVLTLRTPEGCKSALAAQLLK